MGTDYTEPVTVQQKSEFFDSRYYKGIPGLLKLLEVVFSLIAFICVKATMSYCGNWTTYDYWFFITMFCFATTLILYVLLIFKVPQRILRCDCVNWPFVEMCYYAGVIIFLFFGDLFMAIHGSCRTAHQAGDAFGWFALVCYCIDAVLAFLAWRRHRGESVTATTTVTTTQTVEASETAKY